jgi:hypothetical protein
MAILAKKFLANMKRMVSVAALALAANSALTRPAYISPAPALPVSSLIVTESPAQSLQGDSK